LVKISRNSMVTRRVAKLREEVNADTQRLRIKTLTRLEDLFDLAQEMARNPNIKGRRHIWARVAAYIAQVIEQVSKGFDERQMNVYLNELERLVHAARAKADAEETEEGTGGPGAV